MNIQYKGARWFKCDLHLHTPASQCFLDKLVTADEWVQACIDADLQCVAVTDHNTGEWIDQIKEAANSKPLTVLPGVEITCDTSKIHILVIFDSSKTTESINDFLIECGIPRDKFAKPDAFSSKTVSEIARIANDRGALVIPAHIDEFNGLGYCAGKASFDTIIKLPFIHAVQFVHKEFITPGLKVQDNQTLLDSINQYYNKPFPSIGFDSIKNAYNSVQSAIDHNVRLLTFSDNPDMTNRTKHGLSGIGCCYSWIKMDGKPTLEGLRQAFMMPERTSICFENETEPYKLPELWIKSVSVENTTLNAKKTNLFQVHFNPQLTTIIGGRGSGKSSILRFLRGVFGLEKDLSGLDDILADQKSFFKLTDSEGKGVLTQDSRIEVVFVRNGLEYRIIWEYEKKNKPVIERLNVSTMQYEPVEDEAYLDFFVFEEYSQKQIFSIAQRPNSLRSRIDSAIPEMMDLQDEYEQARQDYRELMTKQRTLKQAVQAKGKLLTEIKDLQTKIELLKQTGISELLSQLQQYEFQKKELNIYMQAYEKLKNDLSELILSFKSFKSFRPDVIEEKYREEVMQEVQTLSKSIPEIEQILKGQVVLMRENLHQTDERLKESSFSKDYLTSRQQFDLKKIQLEEKGITDMSDFQKYSQQIEVKNNEIA